MRKIYCLQAINLLRKKSKARRKVTNKIGNLPIKKIIDPNILELLPSQMTKTQVTMVNEAACSSSQADTINSNTNTSVNLNTNKNFTTNSTMNDANGTLASTIPSSALDQSLSRLQAQQSQQLQQQQQANTTNRTCTNNTSSARPSKRSANDYRFGKTIGEGSFSTVYIAQDIHTKREVASKYRFWE